MSKFFLPCVALLLTGGIASAQVVQDLALTKGPGYDIQWQKSFGNPQSESLRSIRPTADGGTVVAGATGSDAWVVRLDAEGKISWQQRYGGAGYDSALDIQPTPDGGYAFVGDSLSFSSNHAPWVVKLDSAGQIQWQRLLDSAVSQESLSAIRLTDDGGYVLAGEAWNPTTSADVWLVKLDASGATQWQKYYGTTGYDSARDVRVAKDGGFVIAGTSSGTGDPLNNGLVFKVSSTGTILWQSGFGFSNFGYGNQDDRAYALEMTSDAQGYIVVGDTRRFYEGLFADVVIRFNDDGSSPWSAVYGGPGDFGNYGMAVASTADGSFLFGAGFNSGTPNGAWLVKGSPSGDVESGCSTINAFAYLYPPGSITLTTTNGAAANVATSGTASATAITTTTPALSMTTQCTGAGAWSRVFTFTGEHPTVQSIAATADGGAAFVSYISLNVGNSVTKLGPPRAMPEAVIFGDDPGDNLGANFSISPCDVNKDGVTDLLIGAGNADGPDNAKPNAGEAYVVLGPIARDRDFRRAADASVRFRGAATGDALGLATAGGDLNNDGYADVIMGAPSRDTGGGTDSGEVDVFFAATTLSGDIDLASVTPDVRITGSVAGGAAGYSLATGDLNNDGKADLVIGAPADNASPGRVYVFYGPITPGTYTTSAANVTVLGRDNDDALGLLVAVGNVNGTGAPDLVASAFTADGVGNAKSNAGEVYVLFGGSLPATWNLATTAPSYEIIGADAGDQLGYGLAVGDVSGDGIADIAVGARLADGLTNARADSGEVFVKFGSTGLSGTLNLASANANVRLLGGRAGDNLGGGIAIADVNNQSPADLIVGASGSDGPTGARTDAGEVDVLLGPLQTSVTYDLASYRPSLAFHGVDASDRFGYWVAAADLSGDGSPDLLAAAIGGDGPTEARSGAGEISLIHSYCTPSASYCPLGDGTCTTFHIETSDSCGCDACSTDALSALLYSNGGPEGAYCAVNESPCTGTGICDGDTNGNFLPEQRYVFTNSCLATIGTHPAASAYELLMRGGSTCGRRKILVRLSGLQTLCE